VLDKSGNATNRFEFRELWLSADALNEVHMKSNHMVNFFSEVGAETTDSFFESLTINGEWVNKL